VRTLRWENIISHEISIASHTSQVLNKNKMQLNKLNMSDPKTVAAVVAIGVLGLGMCVQLVFLFATLFKADKKSAAFGVRKSTRAQKKPDQLDERSSEPKKAKTSVKAAANPKTPESAAKKTAAAPAARPNTSLNFSAQAEPFLSLETPNSSHKMCLSLAEKWGLV